MTAPFSYVSPERYTFQLRCRDRTNDLNVSYRVTYLTYFCDVSGTESETLEDIQRIRQLDRIHIYMYMRDVYSTENGCLGFVWGLFIREPIAGMLAPLARAAREQLDPRASHAPPSRALPRRRSAPC